MSYPNLANGWTAALAGSLTNVATTVDVSSTAGIPARPFQAVITAEGANADEIVTVTGLSGSTLTITRATEANASGSSAASAHASGATISHVLTAQALADLYAAAVGRTFSIVFVFDGGGSAITGNPEVDVVCPAAGTLTGWTMLADVSGSAVVDVWKDSYANYPPTDADAMPGAGKEPTLSSAAKAQDTDIADWTSRTLAAGDILRAHLDSSSTVKRLTLTLTYTRS